ncbi:MAG: HEAT repeat domain-containing protein [Halobacteria archaeon]|nr:HEAT repeat domain-containing protein [Halobacteria archaeon]
MSDSDNDSPSTRDELDDLGFYDNEFTEFPPELSGIKRFKVEGKTEPLVESLDVFEANFLREEVIEALGRIGDPDAVDRLLDEVDDADMRLDAIEALARIGSPKASEKLQELLDPEANVPDNVRAKAADALGEIGDEGATETLVESLELESVRLREAASDALGKIGDEDAVEGLERLLEEETHESVRVSAAKSLSEIGNDRARQVLDGYSDDTNELVAQAAS